MSNQNLNQRVQLAIDHCLSGVQTDEYLYQRVIMRKGETIMKKKIPVALILAMLLMAITVTALAVTIYETIKPVMDQSAVLLISNDWEMPDKIAFLRLMQNQGLIDANDEHLIASMDEDQPDDFRSHEASIAIDAICGDIIQAKRDPTILQQEEYPSPDLETVFTVLYRQTDPEADDNTIKSEFERWFSESELFSDPESIILEDNNTIASEDDIRQLCLSDLTEIYNFNRNECNSTTISISFDEITTVWTATYYVKSNSLRDALKADLGIEKYNVLEDAYTWSRLFSSNGKRLFVSSVEELEWDGLIPQAGYPNWDRWEDALNSFLFCTTEERAEFSKTYKPLVDAYLSMHPNISEYFMSKESVYGNTYNPTIYYITRHQYGTPDDSVITQEKAIDIAFQAWIDSGAQGVWKEMLDSQRSIYCLYDITDPETPLWKVSLSYYYEENPDPNANKDGYFVIVDAQNGQIIDRYIISGPNGMSQSCDSAYAFAELFY